MNEHELEEEIGSPLNVANIVDEEELLAAQEAAEAANYAQQADPGDVFHNVQEGLEGVHRDMLMNYWQQTINNIENSNFDFKSHQLPLARIKKVMKTDQDVKMISAEAPILFAKGCDIFITELTMRAWIHAEENKRRTLQKSDIAAALTRSDMFDFLIDVVPREEEKPKKSYNNHNNTDPSNSSSRTQFQEDQVVGSQYPQQQQQHQQQAPPTSSQPIPQQSQDQISQQQQQQQQQVNETEQVVQDNHNISKHPNQETESIPHQQAVDQQPEPQQPQEEEQQQQQQQQQIGTDTQPAAINESGNQWV
ncbi:CCAAT- binding transcription factor component [Lodderomyces elongisporus]|uniref:CCAAT- binding transcription factor component n=1 Tax=Lodderomyces elongisporus TaxID=36914 RepID=UPI0029209096|nr:CCAAT- binding transcription factor component [Lodderomyces elongisporus]WLF81143.1 CCAAT- binding transcription factor component [Lodderomyces elongisporus]